MKTKMQEYKKSAEYNGRILRSKRGAGDEKYEKGVKLAGYESKVIIVRHADWSLSPLNSIPLSLGFLQFAVCFFIF